MIIVAGEVRFADGEIARLRPAMEKNIAATRAESSGTTLIDRRSNFTGPLFWYIDGPHL